MGESDERMPARRRHRRVVRPGAPGSDPAPALPPRAEAPEERGERDDSNDERLRRDLPPHWGRR
ncbi:hypothetical protein [Gryllotalpicola ginsengisoli]|uniref:hypothetical protein n=1 Tax=Gryllotalpicola ginsengisoli TaxID=444608 RepID=UPI0003B3CFDD|nr:hypothetical protein [Gryllotalpicola ginsengisoli]